ncbi:MAG: restriction endonuclease [Lachnospiraceae bacterium]|nr:restriction endonuclease [Lachnospiraceae bacterium]
MTEYWWIYVLCVLLGAVLTVAWMRRARRRREEAFVPMDDLEGHDFEYYCADLLRANGFEGVRVTKGSGDFGADILAEKDGVTYAVQCKIYSSPIGVFAVQQAVAGREYYHRMVAAVMTNQYYTRAAEEAADRMLVLLWDRDDLARMERFAGKV